MLSRDLCRKCYFSLKEQSSDNVEAFDRFWDDWKKCVCLYQVSEFSNFRGCLIEVEKGNFPKTCPYILEQTLFNQKLDGGN